MESKIILSSQGSYSLKQTERSSETTSEIRIDLTVWLNLEGAVWHLSMEERRYGLITTDLSLTESRTDYVGISHIPAATGPPNRSRIDDP